VKILIYTRFLYYNKIHIIMEIMHSALFFRQFNSGFSSSPFQMNSPRHLPLDGCGRVLQAACGGTQVAILNGELMKKQSGNRGLASCSAEATHGHDSRLEGPGVMIRTTSADPRVRTHPRSRCPTPTGSLCGMRRKVAQIKL